MAKVEDIPAAWAALRGAVAADPALARLELRIVLRALPDRVVARASLDGRSVIVKHFPGEGCPTIVSATEAELARLAPHMSSGRAQVNRCLAASLRTGTVVLSEMPGEKMSRALPLAMPPKRARMLADVGGFVLAYGEGRREMGRFGAGFWLRKLDGLDPGGEDHALLGDLRRALQAQAEALRDAAVCRAAVHGDLVPPNLNVSEGGVFGFDIQGEARKPMSYDLARFLAWIAAEGPPPPGPGWLGVAEADRAALLVPGLPDPGEHPGILPFLLGLQLAGRLHERRADADAGPPARRAVRRYLRGLTPSP